MEQFLIKHSTKKIENSGNAETEIFSRNENKYPNKKIKTKI